MVVAQILKLRWKFNIYFSCVSIALHRHLTRLKRWSGILQPTQTKITKLIKKLRGFVKYGNVFGHCFGSRELRLFSASCLAPNQLARNYEKSVS